jgi:hypothetical protein
MAFSYSGGTYATIDDPLATGGTVVTSINDLGQIIAVMAFSYSGGCGNRNGGVVAAS